MSVAMKPSPVAFWRYILLLALFACELCMTTGPRSFGLLGAQFPDRVAFQHVLFLHQLFIFLSVALSRIILVLLPDKPSIRPDDSRTFEPWIQRLDSLGRLVGAEALRLLHLELHSMNSNGVSNSQNATDICFDSVPLCSPPPNVVDMLTREMEDILVEQFIRAEPLLRALWDEGVRRERGRRSEEDVPVRNSDEMMSESIMNGPKSSKRHSRLPSPSPSLSPEIRLVELPTRANEEYESEPVRDDECEMPVGSLHSPHLSPTQSVSIPDGLELQTSSSRSFIRIVERQHSVSPE